MSVDPIEPSTAAYTSPIPDNMSLELLDVRVYLEDCTVVPIGKTLILFSLPVLDRNCLHGFRVLSKEVFLRIQASSDPIYIPSTGSRITRISVADPEEPDWKMPFARLSPGEPLERIPFNPDALEVPENRRLKIFIDNTTPSPSSGVKSEQGSSSASVLSSRPAMGPSISDQLPAVESDIESESPAVKFLPEKLSLRPGYKTFIANRGRVLANPEIVKEWRFVVEFSNEYTRMKQQLGSFKINKAAIQKALGFGSTWLTSVQRAVQIIDAYSEVQDVSEELERIDESPAGATALQTFLTNWQSEHPL
ncbi:hypothetical protein DFH07DRAFT_766443 [Mycena maculata]|uniref:Uncharacterized protein n=1 Tax=Mycena maculata TaxID=230809 RepID=A0AAD7K5S8_9AGAR|nr:hypothetical protein DFH07DRAFT_766443 [Mycena maculata]